MFEQNNLGDTEFYYVLDSKTQAVRKVHYCAAESTYASDEFVAFIRSLDRPMYDGSFDEFSRLCGEIIHVYPHLSFSIVSSMSRAELFETVRLAIGGPQEPQIDDALKSKPALRAVYGLLRRKRGGWTTFGELQRTLTNYGQADSEIDDRTIQTYLGRLEDVLLVFNWELERPRGEKKVRLKRF